MNPFFSVACFFLKKVLGHHWLVQWKIFSWEIFLHSLCFVRIFFLTFSYSMCFSASSQILADVISPMVYISTDDSSKIYEYYIAILNSGAGFHLLNVVITYSLASFASFYLFCPSGSILPSLYNLWITGNIHTQLSMTH